MKLRWLDGRMVSASEWIRRFTALPIDEIDRMPDAQRAEWKRVQELVNRRIAGIIDAEYYPWLAASEPEPVKLCECGTCAVEATRTANQITSAVGHAADLARAAKALPPGQPMPWDLVLQIIEHGAPKTKK